MLESRKQEYLATLRNHSKRHKPNRNLSFGDVVVLHDDQAFPTKWPLSKIVQAFHGEDGLVRVVKVKTQAGTFRRPITKVSLLLPLSLIEHTN